MEYYSIKSIGVLKVWSIVVSKVLKVWSIVVSYKKHLYHIIFATIFRHSSYQCAFMILLMLDTSKK